MEDPTSNGVATMGGPNPPATAAEWAEAEGSIARWRRRTVFVGVDEVVEVMAITGLKSAGKAQYYLLG